MSEVAMSELDDANKAMATLTAAIGNLIAQITLVDDAIDLAAVGKLVTALRAQAYSLDAAISAAWAARGGS
jgi:hypothetical protein